MFAFLETTFRSDLLNIFEPMKRTWKGKAFTKIYNSQFLHFLFLVFDIHDTNKIKHLLHKFLSAIVLYITNESEPTNSNTLPTNVVDSSFLILRIEDLSNSFRKRENFNMRWVLSVVYVCEFVEAIVRYFSFHFLLSHHRARKTFCRREGQQWGNLCLYEDIPKLFCFNLPCPSTIYMLYQHY